MISAVACVLGGRGGSLTRLASLALGWEVVVDVVEYGEGSKGTNGITRGGAREVVAIDLLMRRLPGLARPGGGRRADDVTTIAALDRRPAGMCMARVLETDRIGSDRMDLHRVQRAAAAAVHSNSHAVFRVSTRRRLGGVLFF